MKRTELSKKISKIHYFMSALKNLKEGTATNKLLVKLWLLSSFLLYMIAIIILLNIGSLKTDSLLIESIIFITLFFVASLLPFLIFSLLYYMSIIIEALNVSLNFIYLMTLKQIINPIRLFFIELLNNYKDSKEEIKAYVEKMEKEI